jgi:hypothetical protein
MTLDDLKDFLDEQGIAYHQSTTSLILRDCPFCGSRKWKTYLGFKRSNEYSPFTGICFAGACGEKLSSSKYLIKYGVDVSEVLRLHGRDPQDSFNSMANVLPDFELTKEKHTEENTEDDKIDVNLNDFMKISDWPNHPASAYANKRGITPDFYNQVMIDPITNSVVFLCKDLFSKEIIGWQKRFVNPTNPNMKTMTLKGFKKSENILFFNKKDCKKIAICEGPFTAVSAWHYGYTSICTFGAKISPEQLRLIFYISEKTNKDIAVAVENDTAGQNCYDTIRSWLYWSDKVVSRISPSIGDDLNDCWALGGTVEEVFDVWGGPAIPSLRRLI